MWDEVQSRCDIGNTELEDFLRANALVAERLVTFLAELDRAFDRAPAHTRYRLDWEPTEYSLFVDVQGTMNPQTDVDRLWNLHDEDVEHAWTFVPVLRYRESHDV